MSDDERNLEELIDLLRRERGSCPESHVLVAYQEGALAPEEAAKIRAHADLCGICQASLQVVEAWQAARRGEEVGEAPDWQIIRGDLRKRVLAFASAGGKPRNAFARFASGLRGLLWRPAVAYIIALILLYPAYRGLFPRQPIEYPKVEGPPVPISAGTAATITLERHDVRGVEARPNVVRPAAGDRYVALQFFVPIRAVPNVEYTARIDGAAGIVVQAGKIVSMDRIGNFQLVVPRERLAFGSYTLIVEEYDRQKNERTATFSFLFEVVE